MLLRSLQQRPGTIRVKPLEAMGSSQDTGHRCLNVALGTRWAEGGYLVLHGGADIL
jgi:hypothetical protein